MGTGEDGRSDDLPKRKRLRLPGYDYSLAGAYFLTINVEQRVALLGKMRGREVELNEVGGMVRQIWHNLPQYYPGVVLDAFIVMPDHIHGIIILVDPRLIARTGGPALSAAPTRLEGTSDSQDGTMVPQLPIAIPA